MPELLPIKSKTDPPAPEQHRAERPIISRRLRASSFRSKGQYNPSNHHHRHSIRHSAKDTVQSAIDLKPPISFDHLLRRDKKSPDSSRRGSGAVQQQQQQNDGVTDTTREEQPKKREIRPEDVAKAKKDNTKREEELRESLKSVEEVAMSSTRQLDDTYYAILEKASMLRSTVASLQRLADECSRMHTSFQDGTAKLERDTNGTVDSFGNFEQQEKKINQLVVKLQESRGKTEMLNDRLESARLRVQSYEEQENAKQAKRRTRWHLMWATLLGIFLLVISILLARNRRAVGKQLDIVGEHLVRIGDLGDLVVAPLATRLRPSPSEDPYLRRLFDEL